MANEQKQLHSWVAPPILVKWRGYFAPSADEQKPVVDMVLSAKDGGLIDQRKAVEAVAQIFGIENIEAYLETLAEETQANEEHEQEKLMDEAKALHQIANGGAAGGKPGGPGKRARPGGGASRSSGTKA